MGDLELAQQQARPDALEAHQRQALELSAVEADLDRTHAAGQSHAVQEFLARPRHLDQQPALARVPPERQETVAALEAGGARGDGRQRRGRGRGNGGRCLPGDRDGEQGQHDEGGDARS